MIDITTNTRVCGYNSPASAFLALVRWSPEQGHALANGLHRPVTPEELVRLQQVEAHFALQDRQAFTFAAGYPAGLTGDALIAAEAEISSRVADGAAVIGYALSMPTTVGGRQQFDPVRVEWEPGVPSRHNGTDPAVPRGHRWIIGWHRGKPLATVEAATAAARRHVGASWTDTDTPVSWSPSEAQMAACAEAAAQVAAAPFPADYRVTFGKGCVSTPLPDGAVVMLGSSESDVIVLLNSLAGVVSSARMVSHGWDSWVETSLSLGPWVPWTLLGGKPRPLNPGRAMQVFGRR